MARMSHDHNHHHAHAPAAYGRAFALGVALNVGFVAIEAFYGWQTQSLALLADAGHNLSDVAGLLLAWAAIAASRLSPTARHTYGWRRGSILASFANAVILLLAMGSLGWEAIQRLQEPSPIHAGTVMVVAGIGVVINAATAALFMAGSKSDLNIRGAFLHMAADALVSVGVVLSGALYLWQGWSWIDPVVSLVIAGVIIMGTWSLFHQALRLLFGGVPESVDLGAVRQSLLELPGVIRLHDLHVWAIATDENALTAHLVLGEPPQPDSRLLHLAQQRLHERFEIRHVTLQLETHEQALTCPVVNCV